MNYIMITIAAFLLSAIACPILIPMLTKLKFGQSILEIGPSWHSKKSGTPTMGGIAFILAISISLLIFIPMLDEKVWYVAFCALGFGIIGFIDDFIKVVLKRNLGLKAWQKFAMQLLVSIIFISMTLSSGVVTTVISIPFANFDLDLVWLYIPFAIFVMLGGTNSVNLTDGLDGLATSITIIVMLFFTIVCKDTSLAFFPAACIGGLLGFLLYNKHPAKVFMGDTGSLFLGGAVCGISLIIGNPLVILIAGFVYLCETLSVMIQVTSFKLTGKRVFKMSPIHHHFEMVGWSEKKIVAIFSLITAIMCILAYFSLR